MRSIMINDMDYEDFSRKVGGSIVRLDDKIVRVERIRLRNDEGEETGRDPDDYQDGDYIVITGMVETTDKRGRLMWDNYLEEISERNGSDIEYDLAFPETGYVNYKGGSLYVTREASRQWKLGFHVNCTRISDKFLRERELDDKTIDMNSIYNNLHFLQRMFRRKYMTYNAVVSSILDKSRIGGAINKYVYIGRSLSFPHMVICYKDIPVGYVDRENLTPYLFRPAEYVQAVLPASATIKETTDDITFRAEWD